MSGLLPRKSLPPDERGLVDRRTGQPRRVTPKMRKAVRLLLDGSCRTLKAAAERVGVSAEYLSRALRQPHVLQYVDEQARVQLATGKMLASARLLELIHAQSEHVSFDASAHALAIAGIRPVGDPAVALNVSLVSPGYVLDLQTDPREALAANHPLRTIEHQREEAPKEPESKVESFHLDGREPANLAKPDAPQTIAAGAGTPGKLSQGSGQRAIPPFPGLVQTGTDRHGNPIFSTDKQKENR